MSGFIDHFLGQRATLDQPFEPGFIRLHVSAIEKAALIGPIVCDILAMLASNRKKIIPCSLQRTRTFKNIFTRKPGEDPVYAKKRIVKNVTIAASVTIAVAAATIGIFILFKKGVLNEIKEHAVSFFDNQKQINAINNFVTGLQTKPIIFTAYSLIGLSHSAMAVWQLKFSYLRVIKHVSGGLVAFATPVVMTLGIYEIRWHHLSYGLLSMLPSLNALNFFGSLLVSDSLLYWIRPLKDNFDFSDIFAMHMTAFLAQIVALSFFQMISARIFQFKETPEPNKGEEMRLLPSEEIDWDSTTV